MPLPPEVTVLTDEDNISGPFGIHTEGYPDTIEEWIRYECKDHLTTLEFTSIRTHILRWVNHLKYTKDAKYKFIISSGLPIHEHLRYEGKVIYNLAWAYLGYIDNQCPVALSLLEYLHSRTVSTEDPRNLYEKLKTDPLPIRPTHTRTKVSHAKKKTINKKRQGFRPPPRRSRT